MTKRPQRVDFKHNYEKMQKHLQVLNDLLIETRKRNEELEKVINKDYVEIKEQKKNIIFISEMKDDIKVKAELLEQYKMRHLTYLEQKKAEFTEYKKYYVKTRQVALDFIKNIRLPKNIRTNLRSILNTEIKMYNEDEKIAYFLVLKKEVEMCRNYIKNSR